MADKVNMIDPVADKIMNFALMELSEEYGCKAVQGGMNDDRAFVTCDDANGYHILVDIKITKNK